MMIFKKLCFSKQYEQHPIRSLCLETRQLYNITQYSNDKTTDYLVRFHNYRKVNEVCNGSIISRGFQEYRMKIIYLLHVTDFEAPLYNDKKKVDTAVE